MKVILGNTNDIKIHPVSISNPRDGASLMEKIIKIKKINGFSGGESKIVGPK